MHQVFCLGPGCRTCTQPSNTSGAIVVDSYIDTSGFTTEDYMATLLDVSPPPTRQTQQPHRRWASGWFMLPLAGVSFVSGVSVYMCALPPHALSHGAGPCCRVCVRMQHVQLWRRHHEGERLQIFVAQPR
jgi:hypothetical protein